jgi:hypothetical protein
MKEEMKFKWLQTRHWCHTIASLLDIPVIVLVYWLNYETAFVLLIVFMVLGEISYGIWALNTEKELGLRSD